MTESEEEYQEIVNKLSFIFSQYMFEVKGDPVPYYLYNPASSWVNIATDSSNNGYTTIRNTIDNISPPEYRNIAKIYDYLKNPASINLDEIEVHAKVTAIILKKWDVLFNRLIFLQESNKYVFIDVKISEIKIIPRMGYQQTLTEPKQSGILLLH